MNGPRRTLYLVVVLCLIASACKESNKVGSKKLLDIKEQQQKERLGEILKSPEAQSTGTPGPAALGVPSATPTRSQPKQEVFEIVLVSATQGYYEQGSELQVSAGTLIRVTNRDKDLWENAQKPRRFKTRNGPYDTGDIPLGQTREFVVNVKGRFQLEDPNLPPATGNLEVF